MAEGKQTSAEGYAAVVDGELMVQTVGHSLNAAKVNALLVLFNIMARDSWGPMHIDDMWRRCMARLAQEQPARAVKFVPVIVVPVATEAGDA